MKEGHGRAQRLRIDGSVPVVQVDGGLTKEIAGVNQRGVLQNAFAGPGRFGKMFPDLDPQDAPPEALDDLGRAMQEVESPWGTSGDTTIPAGFTYLGQFIDHDITFDKTVGFPNVIDPAEIEQARTSSLDLDSLYGLGPRHQPDLYDPATPRRAKRFRIGLTAAGTSPGGSAPGTPPIQGGTPHDLPRRSDGEAIIGDPRNDENLVVAQLHLAFLKFHNKLIDFVAAEEGDDDDHGDDYNYTVVEEDTGRSRFHRARRLVRWHYQWIVLNDFLRRIVDASVLQDVRTNGRQFFKFEDTPGGKLFMPLEFSVAAYRFGHSMIRETYNHNRVFASRDVEPNALAEATLPLLFTFTGGGGGAPIPGNWVIDWRRFFEIGGAGLNVTRSVDTKISPTLHALPQFPPTEPQSLPVRNLLRGRSVGLPSGQSVAEAIGAQVLTPAELTSGPDGPVVQRHGFDQSTPLWYYILKEADVQTGGAHLGAVGSRIVAEVFVGLLEGHNHSFLRKEPGWSPTLPSATPGDFTMVDLLNFVGEINPIG